MISTHEQNYSDAIAYEIDLEIQSIIREQYDRCKKLINEKRIKLESIAQALLKVETLNSQQIRDLIEKGKTEDDKIIIDEVSPSSVRVIVANEESDEDKGMA